jgi:L-rhamnose mutarotase
MYKTLFQYLSVADNERDAVLLHVSASSERQEWGNETSSIKKKTEQNKLTQTAMPMAILACVLFSSASGIAN